MYSSVFCLLYSMHLVLLIICILFNKSHFCSCIFLCNFFLHLMFCILPNAYGTMHIMLSFSFYARRSSHLLLFYVSHYTSDSIHLVLCPSSWSHGFHSTCSLHFIQCISMLHLVTCISLYSSHYMHCILCIPIYMFHSINLFLCISFYFAHLKYCWNSLETDRPTNRQTLSHIELLSQLKTKL
jgi:hypothetical protein